MNKIEAEKRERKVGVAYNTIFLKNIELKEMELTIQSNGLLIYGKCNGQVHSTLLHADDLDENNFCDKVFGLLKCYGERLITSNISLEDVQRLKKGWMESRECIK